MQFFCKGFLVHFENLYIKLNLLDRRGRSAHRYPRMAARIGRVEVTDWD